MATDWRIALTKDDTSGDSDKIFTVPGGTEWEILWIWIEYTSSATTGERQVEIQLQDNSTDIIAQWQTKKTQAANLSYNYLLAHNIPDLGILRDDDYLMTPLIGNMYLSAGQYIRIWDNNAIDSSGDNMSIKIEYGYRTL